jgi:hypothetical protein
MSSASVFTSSPGVDVPTRFADEGRDADVRDELPRLEGVDGPLVVIGGLFFAHII